MANVSVMLISIFVFCSGSFPQWLAPRKPERLRYKKDGDIIIGGISSIQVGEDIVDYLTSVRSPCTSFDIQSYREVLVIMFVIEEVNQNQVLLPNITLGFDIFGSCDIVLRSIESTIWFLNGGNRPLPNYNCYREAHAVAMIAELWSANSVAVARILGLQRFPQISNGAEDPNLNDWFQFPSFLRSISNNLDVHNGIIQLLRHFQWTWVWIMFPYNLNSMESSLILKNKLINSGICIELSEAIPFSSAGRLHLIQLIKSSSVKVIICNSGLGLPNLMEALVKHNISGINWIALDWWPLAAYFNNARFHKLLCGALWFDPEVKMLPGFKNFLYTIHPLRDPKDVFSTLFWEKVFGCKWPKGNDSQPITNDGTIHCTGQEDLKMIDDRTLRFFRDNPSFHVYSMYNAAYSIVYALHELLKCRPGEGNFLNGSCASLPHVQPWQLFHYLLKVHFSTPVNEEIFFDESRHIQGTLSLVNWQVMANGLVVMPTVGNYDPKKPSSTSLSVKDKAIMWNQGSKQIPRSVCSESCLPGYRRVAQKGRPPCCYDCIQCAEGEISNYSDSTNCLVCLSEEWPNERKDKCVTRDVQFLSYNEPLGIALASIATISTLLTATVLVIFVKFSGTAVVKANNQNLSYLILVSLMLCFLCSLIFIGQPNKVTCKLSQSGFGITFVLSVSSVLAKAITVVVAFNATRLDSPLKKCLRPELPYSVVSLSTVVQLIICVVWNICAPPFPERNFNTHPGLIIIGCSEGSPIAFWGMLGYMGLLASICFVVAFLSRDLPDSFNEAKFITFSMVVFVSVWLAFIPAYLSTTGKYTVAVEVFAVVASALGLLICIFFPKCYIIILKPDINTKEYLTRKIAPGNRKPC